MNRWRGYLVCAALVLGLCAVSWGQAKATNPNPADGALDVVAPLLRWTPGIGTMAANVYFGTTPDLGAEQLVQAQNPSPLYYHGPGFVPGTTYYWRVDTILVDGTVVEGDVWSFLAFPLKAYHPSPADGSTTAPVAPELTWLGGQDAQGHHVYFSADQAAVADAAAGADEGSTNDPNFAPGELLPVTTYYWRVDELQLDGSELAGDVWSFTTVLPVDDFESYTNDVGSRAFEVWIDGVGFSQPEPGNPGNGTGAAVGHDIWTMPTPYTTIMETATVHGGVQSMPVYFDNTAAPFYSQVDRSWSTPQDWTINGIDALTLHVQGPAADFEIPSVTTPPVLDGEVEELWNTASVQYVTLPISNAPSNATDSSGSFRALYDSQSLYVLVDVNDEALVQDSDASQGWLDDRVEVFIDGDNSKNAAQDGVNDYQYNFRWNFGQVEVPVEWYLPPDSLAGVEYAVVTTETGYLLEIKLPWMTMIGGPPRAGQMIGIDVMIGDDDDGGDRDSQISWHLPSGTPHNPSGWGTALLVEPAVDGTDRLYVAIQDSSNRTAVVTHPDAQIVKATAWQPWTIALSEFADAGVNVTGVRKLSVGVGDPAAPAQGGSGLIFLDDVYLAVPMPSDADDPNATE